MAAKKNGTGNRIALVRLAQDAAQRFEHPARSKTGRGHRVVVVVTDEDGTFIGVGSNTAGDDADRILRCALIGEDLIFHEGADFVEPASPYSRAGRTAAKPTELRRVGK